MDRECEECGALTDDLGVCPHEGCEYTQELCADCLFEHMIEHDEEMGG